MIAGPARALSRSQSWLSDCVKNLPATVTVMDNFKVPTCGPPSDDVVGCGSTSSRSVPSSARLLQGWVQRSCRPVAPAKAVKFWEEGNAYTGRQAKRFAFNPEVSTIFALTFSARCLLRKWCLWVALQKTWNFFSQFSRTQWSFY